MDGPRVARARLLNDLDRPLTRVRRPRPSFRPFDTRTQMSETTAEAFPHPRWCVPPPLWGPAPPLQREREMFYNRSLMNPRARSFNVFWLPPLLYVVLIYILSGMSHPPVPEGVDQDLLHFPEYAVLGFLLARAIQGGRPGRAAWAAMLAAFLLSAIVGASDEFHQAFVPERVPDVADWWHDMIGAAAGVLAWGGYRWTHR